MANWHSKETDDLIKAITELNTVEECYTFFEDVCTIKEIIEIAQRLRVAKLLDSGLSYQAISKETGASTATISRVSKCLEYGNGGYRAAIQRLKEGEPTT
ncbi:MAG: helix-turn-helix domain-containing protein [Clostridia bacterium]|nr:helix-turn-helix domain-containing protein [Clostridia bacterium]